MQKNKLMILVLLGVGLVVLLSACGTAQQVETPAADLALENFAPIVSATGEVVPVQTALLSPLRLEVKHGEGL
ncbi:MAG: hypothetical protein MUO62_17410 [Anaerolineales bacterium]|nr:hypothetical protein [Anaerolineales bacterium]